MKNVMISLMVGATVMLAGCGDDAPKTAQEIQFKQEKEIMAMQLAHERQMKDKEIELARAEAGLSNAPINRLNENNPYRDDSYRGGVQEPEYYNEPSGSYSESYSESYSGSPSRYASQAPAATQSQQMPMQSQQPQQVAQGDEGFGVGSMALAALGGAAAGYFAGEMLNNGMKSYKDDKGNVHYTDKDGRPVSKSAYEDYKKKNPRTQAFRENVRSAKSSVTQKASNMKSSVTQKASDMKSSVSQKASNVNNSAKMQSFRQNALDNKKQMQNTPAYQKSRSSATNFSTKAKSTISRGRSGGFGSKKR